MRHLFFILIILFSFKNILGQERIEYDAIYFDDYLAYKQSDDQIFTGITEKPRKNGQPGYEEVFVDGVLKKGILYYNRTKPPKVARVYEYYENSFQPKTEISYGLKKPREEYIHFNKDGKKVLVEIYENDTLIYHCKYVNKKKNGIEYCLNADGTEIRTEYKNGKKIKR